MDKIQQYLGKTFYLSIEISCQVVRITKKIK